MKTKHKKNGLKLYGLIGGNNKNDGKIIIKTNKSYKRKKSGENKFKTEVKVRRKRKESEDKGKKIKGAREFKMKWYCLGRK